MPSIQFAKLIAIVGLLLIFVAGFITGRDELRRGSKCELAGQLTPAPDDDLQVLDVASTDSPRTAVVELGRPLCVTVANVRSAADLASAETAVNATKAARDETTAELSKARRELRTATGDARKAVDTRVKDLATQLTQENEAVTKAEAARSAQMNDVELALFIDDKRTPSRVFAKAQAAPQALRFELEQSWDASSDDARSWRELLSGLPKGGKRAVPVGVGAPDANLPAATWQSAGPKVAPRSAELIVFEPLAAWLAGAGFVLLLVAILVAGLKTSMLRDGDQTNSRYSLGRVQMAFWTVLAVFGFVFIWTLTGQYINVITTATFTLLGISGATALAAAAIEDPKVTSGQGKGTAPASTSFFTDILADGSGEFQLHRIQVALWTLVFGSIYVWNILNSLVLTEFDPNMLVLLGIANGVYAGFKTQEKP